MSYSIDTRNIFPDSVAGAESYVLVSRATVTLGPWPSAELAIVPGSYRVAEVLDTAAGWRRVLTIDGMPPLTGTAGLWVQEEWWQSVSDSTLPDSAVRLPSGRAGVEAACR
jgi:hypothetical protein